MMIKVEDEGEDLARNRECAINPDYPRRSQFVSFSKEAIDLKQRLRDGESHQNLYIVRETRHEPRPYVL
jgi:hypothetical protein